MTIKIIIIFILITYLCYQSVSDAKTMEVLVWPNNLAVFFSVSLYIYDCIRLNAPIPIEVIMIVLFIILFSYLKVYGRGDMKAMIAVFFTLRYLNSTYPHPDIFIFLISIFVSDIIFIIWNYVAIFIKKEKRKYGAYFPFLTIGCVFGILISIF